MVKYALPQVCLGVEAGFILLSGGGISEGLTNLTRKIIPDSGSIKKQTYNQTDRFLRRWINCGYIREITSTVTAPGMKQTDIRRKVWNKIFGGKSVQKLANKCGYLIH